jgi:hypothetical protein
MGWSGGEELADKLYCKIRQFIPPEKRREIARKFYNEFCDHDADTWSGATRIEKDGKLNQPEIR